MHWRSILAAAAVCSLLLGACASSLKGADKSGHPARAQKWVLIEYREIPEKGPARAPDYLWLAEGNLRWFFEDLPKTRLARIAPPEMWVKFGPAPGPIAREYLAAGQVAEADRTATTPRTEFPTPIAPTPPWTAAAREGRNSDVAAPKSAVGFVVYAKDKEVVIDLTAKDGLAKGARIALWREGPPLRHPVTGAYLGNLDEELGTAVVTEVRDKYSVAKIEKLEPGATIQPKDRAGFPAP